MKNLILKQTARHTVVLTKIPYLDDFIVNCVISNWKLKNHVCDCALNDHLRSTLSLITML